MLVCREMLGRVVDLIPWRSQAPFLLCRAISIVGCRAGAGSQRVLSASCCSALQCNEGRGQVLKVGDHLITQCLCSPVVLPLQKHPRTCASVGGRSAVLKILAESSFY